jgi:hypothetical protein
MDLLRLLLRLAMCFILVVAAASCSRSRPADDRNFTAVPAPTRCAVGDRPEVALQGQVPAQMRATGFNGFNCNLKLAGKYTGEGGGWGSVVVEDGSQHVCAYYATGNVRNVLTNKVMQRSRPGTQIVDVTDPDRPRWVGNLTSGGMLDPWESLKYNPRRHLLAATAGANSVNGNAELDLYDVSGDCRHPELLSDRQVGTGTDGGLKLPRPPIGHEGNFAPDGRTFYVGDIVNETYNAVDVSDPRAPKVIASFDMRQGPLAGIDKNGTSHGLSISDDGNRGYFVSSGFPNRKALRDPKAKVSDGFYVVDTSEVQRRAPHPVMKLISSVAVRDGSLAQLSVSLTVGGRPYLVFVQEGGSVGSYDVATASSYVQDVEAACAAQMTPFPAARIYDLSDEKRPKLVSKLMLQVHDPRNCSRVTPDLTGLTVFTYGSHYCTVDNRQHATALACSYLNSGIRVFDIRDPSHPREIAYFNPPGTATVGNGSIHAQAMQWHPRGPDWCTSRVDFDFRNHSLTTMCMDNGLMIMRFENGVWPMKESLPTSEQTN